MERRQLLQSFAFGSLAVATPALAAEAARITVTELEIFTVKVIVMPDVKYCDGVLELKKIAALAEGAGLLVAPHGPASPVGNVVAAHVCATLPNFHILEFSYGEVPWRAEVIDPPESVLEGGYLALTGRSE